MSIFEFFKKKNKVVEESIEISSYSETPVLKTSEIHEIEFISIINSYKNKILSTAIEYETTNTTEIYDYLFDTFHNACYVVIENQMCSTSLLQRKLRLGYNLANNTIDQLNTFKIINIIDFQESIVLIKNIDSLEETLSRYKALIMPIISSYINENIDFINSNIDEKKESNVQHKPDSKKRERITQEVMDKVWNRDNGRCVLCGSQENIEFDHIIPFSKGGSNTYRNLQILCKKCNLAKSNKIG